MKMKAAASSFVLIFAVALSLAAGPKQTMLMNRLGPSQMTLYIANADGSGERPLFPSSGFDYNASFSPARQWIAFSSDRNYDFKPHEFPQPGWEHPQELSIYIIHPDGTGLRRLTMKEGVSTGSPKWSPDSKRVAFYELPTAHTFAARIYAQGMVTSQIVSVDVASGARTEQTSGPGLKVSPQYLSGDRIANLIKPRPNAGLAFTSGAAGMKGMLRNPAWSPDGKQVVYQKVDFTARPQNQPLYSWDPDMDVQYTDVFPRFSRDGKLAISDIRNLATTAAASISVMNWDGSDRKVVFSDKNGAAFVPTWSPDGQWIAFGFGGFFGARETTPAKLMMARADGSQQSKDPTHPLPNTASPTSSPHAKNTT